MCGLQTLAWQVDATFHAVQSSRTELHLLQLLMPILTAVSRYIERNLYHLLYSEIHLYVKSTVEAVAPLTDGYGL